MVVQMGGDIAHISQDFVHLTGSSLAVPEHRNLMVPFLQQSSNIWAEIMRNVTAAIPLGSWSLGTIALSHSELRQVSSNTG